MKIKIKDLKPNPYRDMEHYPINQEKVQSLIDSYGQTGFWDNILARKVNGDIQIAYGHHRLEALKKKFSPDYEVDIPIKDLPDAIMLKVMAQENEYISNAGVAITDETVRVTRQFLKEHPEEIKTKNPTWKSSSTSRGGVYNQTPEAFQIHEFLGWSELRVYESLLRIDAIESGELDKEAVESLPTEKAAERFRKTVKTKGLKKHQQKKLVRKLNEKESYGDSAINDALWEEEYKELELRRSALKRMDEEKLIKFEDLIQEIISRADNFSEGLSELMKFKDQFVSENYEALIKKYILLSVIDRINKQAFNFLKIYKDEKVKEQLPA